MMPSDNGIIPGIGLHCGSPAVATGPVLRIAGPGNPRVHRRNTRPNPGLSMGDGPSGPPPHCKKGSRTSLDRENSLSKRWDEGYRQRQRAKLRAIWRIPDK
jgi:hypothetical protein